MHFPFPLSQAISFFFSLSLTRCVQFYVWPTGGFRNLGTWIPVICLNFSFSTSMVALGILCGRKSSFNAPLTLFQPEFFPLSFLPLLYFIYFIITRIFFFKCVALRIFFFHFVVKLLFFVQLFVNFRFLPYPILMFFSVYFLFSNFSWNSVIRISLYQLYIIFRESVLLCLLQHG